MTELGERIGAGLWKEILTYGHGVRVSDVLIAVASRSQGMSVSSELLTQRCEEFWVAPKVAW